MNDDIAKLKATLRRAAADGPGLPKAQPISGPEDGAGRILEAIDATLLPRRLSVRASGGETLVIEAAARRLQRFAAPLPEGMSGEAGSELKGEDVAAVAEGLLAFCSGQTSLQITTQPMTDAGDPTESGIALQGLREALGLPAPPPPIDPEADLNMEPFIASLGATCHAALWIQDEDVSLLAGPEDRAGMLSQWAAPMLERLLAPEFPLSAGLETDGICVFVLPEIAARHAVIAGRLGAYFVAEIDGADPSRTLRLWHEAHR